MHEETADYYRTRESAERAAAETATCPQARAAHLQLAEAYALLAETKEAQPNEPRSIPLT